MADQAQEGPGHHGQLVPGPPSWLLLMSAAAARKRICAEGGKCCCSTVSARWDCPISRVQCVTRRKDPSCKSDPHIGILTLHSKRSQTEGGAGRRLNEGRTDKHLLLNRNFRNGRNVPGSAEVSAPPSSTLDVLEVAVKAQTSECAAKSGTLRNCSVGATSGPGAEHSCPPNQPPRLAVGRPQ